LLGWHWAFLPAFLTELVPFVDLVPTWTIAVFLATRGQDVTPGAPNVPGPPPPGLPPGRARGPSGAESRPIWEGPGGRSNGTLPRPSSLSRSSEPPPLGERCTT